MADGSAKNAGPSNTVGKPRATKRRGRVPNYALISFALLLFCGALLILLIVNADRLSRFGLTQQVYYLVLVPMGLAAAGFLFGVLQSSAEWAGEVLGGTLRLSDSIVGAALVVFGGYLFIPKETFFLRTVYVHGEGGSQDVVLRNSGRVFLKLGPEISSESIGENGQAVFPRIPSDFRGQQVPGWIESEDYETSNTTVTIAGNNVDLIVKKKIKHFTLAGTISDKSGMPLPNVRVSLPEYHLVEMTKNDGRFSFQVTADREEMTDLTAEEQGYSTVLLRPTLGDSQVNFSLKGARNAAR